MKTEAWQYRTVFIATPMYGGQCCGPYTDSMMQLATLAVQRGVQMNYYPIFNESHIDRGRNYCADQFLSSDCTHMLFVDADIQFRAEDVLELLKLADPASDRDIICAMYPKKSINWAKVLEAAKSGIADKNPMVLEHFMGDMVFTPLLNDESYRARPINELTQIHEAGCGFMMIQRRVFERIRKAHPDLTYFRLPRQQAGPITCFFDGKVDPQTKRHLSEDYAFCGLVRDAGMKIWLAPWIKLNHYGFARFIGDVEALSAVGNRKAA